MKHGYIKVAAATPKIIVADCDHNATQIINIIEDLSKKSVKIIVFPELCITGYTCGDLFFQESLLKNSLKALEKIIQSTKNKDTLVIVGLPYDYNGNLFNVAAVIKQGELLGLVPKLNIPDYSEFYESRYFVKGNNKPIYINVSGNRVPFGANIIFTCSNIKELKIAVEICEDLWVSFSPSNYHAIHGATIIANLSASSEITGKSDYRRELIKAQSSKLICGYIYADAGEGESTTDLVFSGHNIISENGTILLESERFLNQSVITDLDLNKISIERRKMTTFTMDTNMDNYEVISFAFNMEDIKLNRIYSKSPFIPSDKHILEKRLKEIITIQAMGLKKRLEHTNTKYAVVGISGGLDSTLALLITANAFDLLNMSRENILAITMPCFGTTDRTYNNALKLMDKLNTTIKEIDIKESVIQHFKDIDQDINNHDITFENAQARERTKVLMNISNKVGGMVIGTGDLSELCLGWATYNGDHMSMYGVNTSIPKTLVRFLVQYYADETKDLELKKVLLDILDTPVSPELLPPNQGEIAQKTEDIVGPYELHDFFLYYIIRYGFTPSKIYRIAISTFEDIYTKEEILKWLNTFYKRFFSQQFKRSCLPDGPKVGSVSVSPRGDLRMPSDASVNEWIKELQNIN